MEEFSYDRAGDVGRFGAWHYEPCSVWPAHLLTLESYGTPRWPTPVPASTLTRAATSSTAPSHPLEPSANKTHRPSPPPDPSREVLIAGPSRGPAWVGTTALHDLTRTGPHLPLWQPRPQCVLPCDRSAPALDHRLPDESPAAIDVAVRLAQQCAYASTRAVSLWYCAQSTQDVRSAGQADRVSKSAARAAVRSQAGKPIMKGRSG
jgi:hypothetical protein